MKVPDDLPDDGDLLRIFLSEAGQMWLDYVEEFGADGPHAVEVPRAEGPLEPQRGPLHVQCGRIAGRIDLLNRRDEDRVNSGRGGDLGITRFLAWIGGEVCGIVELSGVHEDSGDDMAARGARRAKQGDMAVVQCAHGRDEADG